VLQRFLSSEAPTDLNSDGREKLRARGWLISAILREISQLSRRGVTLKSPASNGVHSRLRLFASRLKQRLSITRGYRDALALDGRDAHPYTTHRLQSKILSRLET
jgi:hypothetical protein